MPAGEHAVHQWVRCVRYDWIIPCSATLEGVVHSQLVSFQPCFFSCCQPVGGFAETLLYAYSVYTHYHICSSQGWKIQTSTSILNKRPFLLRVIWFLALCLGNVTAENLVTIAESKEVAGLKIGPVTRLVPRIRKSGKFFACGNQNPGLKRRSGIPLKIGARNLRALSKSQNWPAGPQPDQSFWQWKILFSKCFCWNAISFIHAI